MDPCIRGCTCPQIGYLEGVIRTQEGNVAEFEAESVRLTQEYEERQLRWEHREVELERQIATLERQAAMIAGAAAKVRLLHC